MLKKILVTAGLIIMIATSAMASVSAEEGYIFQLKDDVIIPFAATEGVETVVAEDAIYSADSLEDVYNFVDKSAIKYIGRDVPVYLFDADTSFDKPNDPAYEQGYQWNIDMINIMPVWKKGYYGDNSTICVIDSGLNINHEDLDKKKVISAYNIFDNSDDVTDSLGHGTMVTGVISAKINNEKAIAGISDKSDIVSIKAFDDGKETTTSVLIKALDKVCETEGIDVLNMSLGTTPGQEIDRATVKIFGEAIDKVVNKGIIVIASVGNAGNEELSYPAAFDNVIGVGAVAKNKQKCYFSQYNESVFVVAPGGRRYNSVTSNKHDIISLSSSDSQGVVTTYGTSFSAPQVASVASIAKSIYPDLSTEQFKEILKNTSEDLGDEGYDTSYGYGLIDADKVIEAVKELAENPPEVTPAPTPGGFKFDPDDYVFLEYDKEAGEVLIEAYDRDAVLYAVKFDGLKLESIKKIPLNTIGEEDTTLYEIPLAEAPTKLFLWHDMIGCMKAWVDEDYVIPTSEPTAEPTNEPTSEPTAEPSAEPVPTPYADEESEQAIVDLINAARAEANVNALNVDTIGVKVSRDMVWDMFEKDYDLEGGKDKNGKHPAGYISEQSEKTVSALPIYLKSAYSTAPEKIMEAIVDTSGLEKVTKAEFTQIGVGVVRDEKTDRTRWLINLFYYIDE